MFFFDSLLALAFCGSLAFLYCFLDCLSFGVACCCNSVSLWCLHPCGILRLALSIASSRLPGFDHD
jgi:hypothetical protein